MMFLFSFFSGFLNALSYRLDSLGFVFVLLSFSVIFYIYLKNTKLICQLLHWFLFGLSYYITSLFWMNEHLSQDYSDSKWIQFVLWPFLILGLSFSFILIPFVLFRIKQSLLLATLPFVLVLFDLLREHTDFSVPWLHPGFFALDIGLTGWLSIIGALGVSFLFYTLVSLITWLFFLKKKPLYPLLTLVLYLTSVVLVEKCIQLPNVLTNTSVRILHGNFDKNKKISKYDVIKRIQYYAALSMQAPKQKLVIWPESTMSAPYEEIKLFVGKTFNLLKSKEIKVVWGGQFRTGDYLQNVIYRSDVNTPIYYKQRLVPFGEYRPTWFKRWFKDVSLSQGEDLEKPPHNSLKEHQFESLNSVMAVCYESLYSNVFTSKLSQANVAFLLSDLEWTNTNWVKKIFLKITRVRAAEIGKSIVYSTNQGQTSLISPQGIVLAKTESKKTNFIDVSVPLTYTQTFYTKYKHQWLLWSSFIFILIMYFISIFGYLKHKKQIY